MKSLTAPLLAHLQTGGPFTMADLYTITLASGAVLRWTDYDADLLHPSTGFTHSSSGPVLARGRTRVVIGVEVDTLDLSIFPQSSDAINGVAMLTAAMGGAFDGATIKLERAFVSAAPIVVGVVWLFSGRFADVGISRTEMKVRANSATEALQTMLPRNLFQPGCTHTLYDVGCAIDRATFADSCTAGSGCTTTLINLSTGRATGYYDRGYVVFSGGALDGVRRTIKSQVAGVINLFLPLPSVPGVGAAFTAYPGCDKSQATCTSKFSNVIHFRGTPYIPIPETTV